MMKQHSLQPLIFVYSHSATEIQNLAKVILVSQAIFKKDVWWYRTWRRREVGDSSQSFSSDTLQGISSVWSGNTTELVHIQKRSHWLKQWPIRKGLV